MAEGGLLEKGILRRRTGGTPQGGVISPLLAHIYLHHVLDEWFEQVARPRLKGRCQLVRYADDAVRGTRKGRGRLHSGERRRSRGSPS